MDKRIFSWPVILLAFWLFWPAGIVLLVRKIKAERHRYLENGKSLRIMAAIPFAIALLFFILGLRGDLQYEDGTSALGIAVVISLIFVGCGVFTLSKGNQLVARSQRYELFFSELSSKSTLDIDPIAKELNITFQDAAADIQAMIDHGHAANVYIDHIRRRLVAKQVARAVRYVTCPHCGGKNEIEIGTVAVCEYCDSPI